MNDRDLIVRVAEKLRGSAPEGAKVLLGFDGFVDTPVRPVRKRYDADHYDPVPTLKEYGDMISAAAGLSLNVEMVPGEPKLGGNGPILANSLIGLGCDVTYIGALGKDSVFEAFRSIRDRARVISISDPGQTDAIEFLDGKIISCKLSPLNDVSWDSLRARISVEELSRIMDGCTVTAMVNWSLVNHMQTIWDGIYEEVVPRIRAGKDRKIFFDLADPEKRTSEDLIRAVECMRKYGEAFDVTLGLNYREALQLARLLGCGKTDAPDALRLAEDLRSRTGVGRVLVHPVKEACGADEKGSARVPGPFCPEPKLTTGAGDNFNAGFLLGQILGFDLEESLLLGTANSGFYVRHARSADHRELTEFLRDWAEEKI